MSLAHRQLDPKHILGFTLLSIILIGCGFPSGGVDELKRDLGSNHLHEVVTWGRQQARNRETGELSGSNLISGLRRDFLTDARVIGMEGDSIRVVELTFNSGLELRRLIIGPSNFVSPYPKVTYVTNGVYLQVLRN